MSKIVQTIFGLASVTALISGVMLRHIPSDRLPDRVLASGPPSVPYLKFDLVGTIPREASHFTQGLLFHGGELFESTGLDPWADTPSSTFQKTNASGVTKVLKRHKDPSIFGEGLAFLDGKFYQGTWTNHSIYVYNLKGQLIETKPYSGEVWGLTTDGKDLILSDGTGVLKFLDPGTLKVVRSLELSEEGKPFSKTFRVVKTGSGADFNFLAPNELEYVDGSIYANLYGSNDIAVFKASTGELKARIDLSFLYDEMDLFSKAYIQSSQDFVLNGIAYDAQAKIFYVTGKDWPFIFKLQASP